MRGARESVLSPGVGYADDYWHRYYTPDDVEQILALVTHTTIATSGFPLAVRVFPQEGPAPTILMTHGVLPYALMLGRFHLAFHRAGFNVVTADLPGYGLSGGPRAGTSIPQLIQMWRDLKSFAVRELGPGPMFSAATAEDSVTSYYAYANDPEMTALSLHLLLEYGDVENLNWHGSRAKVRAMMLGVRLARFLRLDLKWDAEKALPWEDIIDPHVETYKRDPVVIDYYRMGLVSTMATRMPPPVRFEDCRTPCQMIVSEKSRLWPLEHNRRCYERLGCPKEWVLLEGAPQWSLHDDYLEAYTAHVIRWFRENLAPDEVVESELSAPSTSPTSVGGS